MSASLRPNVILVSVKNALRPINLIQNIFYSNTIICLIPYWHFFFFLFWKTIKFWSLFCIVLESLLFLPQLGMFRWVFRINSLCSLRATRYVWSVACKCQLAILGCDTFCSPYCYPSIDSTPHIVEKCCAERRDIQILHFAFGHKFEILSNRCEYTLQFTCSIGCLFKSVPVLLSDIVPSVFPFRNRSKFFNVPLDHSVKSKNTIWMMMSGPSWEDLLLSKLQRVNVKVWHGGRILLSQFYFFLRCFCE